MKKDARRGLAGFVVPIMAFLMLVAAYLGWSGFFDALRYYFTRRLP